MKKIVLLLLLTVSVKCYSQRLFLDDKNRNYGPHFIGGFVIGTSVGVIHQTPKTAFWSALVSGAGAGVVKEISDRYQDKPFSYEDIILTTAGAVVSAFVVRELKRKKYLRKFYRTQISKSN